MTARPTHQRRNVLIDFKVLLAATGAPRCSIAEITSTTSRLPISWMLLPAQAFPISRRSSLAISAPDRFWDRRWSMNLSSRSATRSATTRRFFSRFSAAGSRPSTLAAKTFCAAVRAWCRVTCPYGPMVYLRSFAPAPPVRYRTMNTLRPFRRDLDAKARERGIPVDYVGWRSRQCVDDRLGQLHARHGTRLPAPCYLYIT
jgi:hypothetical protein